jgi:hypothetical protein
VILSAFRLPPPNLDSCVRRCICGPCYRMKTEVISGWGDALWLNPSLGINPLKSQMRIRVQTYSLT